MASNTVRVGAPLLLLLALSSTAAAFSPPPLLAVSTAHLRQRSACRVTMQARRQVTVEKDPYMVLGIDRKADGATIRQAYTEKAKTCHPDVSATPDASAFLEISNA
eukprot:1673193-Rhodomonas_salina.3